MESAERLASLLIERLPAVRGRLNANEPLGRFTWFKVGGPADVLFQPADAEDLSAFLTSCPSDVPVMVLGNASNILVRDGGVRGVVIRLGRGSRRSAWMANTFSRVAARPTYLLLAQLRTQVWRVWSFWLVSPEPLAAPFS